MRLPPFQYLEPTNVEEALSMIGTHKETVKIMASAEAAFQVASPTSTNMATVGGNLLQNTRCMYYDQSGMVLNGLERCRKRGGTVCLAVKGGKRCFSVYQIGRAHV